MGQRGRPARWRDRLLLAVVPVVLVAVAATQVVRTHTHDQSSWFGTGFGMFATLDSYRFVRAWSLPDGEPLSIPPSRAAHLARTVPQDGQLKALADELLTKIATESSESIRVEVRAIEPALRSGGLAIDVVVLNAVELPVVPAR
jgi:hypothetical protein